jgi:hypothetical protein
LKFGIESVALGAMSLVIFPQPLHDAALLTQSTHSIQTLAPLLSGSLLSLQPGTTFLFQFGAILRRRLYFAQCASYDLLKPLVPLLIVGLRLLDKFIELLILLKSYKDLTSPLGTGLQHI